MQIVQTVFHVVDVHWIGCQLVLAIDNGTDIIGPLLLFLRHCTGKLMIGSDLVGLLLFFLRYCTGMVMIGSDMVGPLLLDSKILHWNVDVFGLVVNWLDSDAIGPLFFQDTVHLEC